MALFSHRRLAAAVRTAFKSHTRPQLSAGIVCSQRWYTQHSDQSGDAEQVLVTGATGYIGMHLVRQLIQAGYKVRGTVRSLLNPEKINPLREMDQCGQLELVEADLLDPKSWPPAVRGCKYVHHVAGPVPYFGQVFPAHEEVLVQTVLGGTLEVLRACTDAGVRRVVLTSSAAAVFGNTRLPDKVFTEQDWSSTSRDIDRYSKYKTVAEEAAWSYLESLPAKSRFELAVINPTLVIGPAVSGLPGPSTQLFKQLLERRIARVPSVQLPTVDVRDVAAAHVAAMTSPQAAGQRHLVTADTSWLVDISHILAEEFQGQGYNPPTQEAGYWRMWLAGRLNKNLRGLLPLVDREVSVDSRRFTEVLQVKPRPLQRSVLDEAYSLIEKGVVERKARK